MLGKRETKFKIIIIIIIFIIIIIIIATCVLHLEVGLVADHVIDEVEPDAGEEGEQGVGEERRLEPGQEQALVPLPRLKSVYAWFLY